ncbi:hypothetical protein [Kutzneria albida]|uniref:Uncharacterized protein n=1 Tax=Kutzneria albida DSM 43870 TaxID=1449976 RepID=W5WAV7_9PSEU|nr:hypothetical protein [Kutzneria albida]AHH98263.1 hypothetical protein KALB_4901 [Kutzneria albida DSM 43870]
MTEPLNTGHCHVCRSDMPSVDLLNHLRLLHPDVWGALETWPDGHVVIFDDSVEPNDFKEKR